MAERLGKTVAELLTGQAQPLSYEEFCRWVAFTKVYNARQKKAQEEAARKK